MTGDELREFREKVLGLSTREFARALGMPTANQASSVRGWERGYRAVPFAIQTIVELAKEKPAVQVWLTERGVESVGPPITQPCPVGASGTRSDL